MHSMKWGGAVLGVAALAVVAALQPRGSKRAGQPHAPSTPPSGLVLVGYLEATGVDLERCEVRCTALRLEEVQRIRTATLAPDGRFELTGLDDVDYCLEVVVRSNPTMVVARRDYVRPGGEELVLEYDPTMLFGPAASAFDDTQ